ncbi:MAG: hypothetical protein ABL876_16995, partial [Chitinophagaceae bacterium]
MDVDAVDVETKVVDVDIDVDVDVDVEKVADEVAVDVEIIIGPREVVDVETGDVVEDELGGTTLVSIGFFFTGDFWVLGKVEVGFGCDCTTNVLAGALVAEVCGTILCSASTGAFSTMYSSAPPLNRVAKSPSIRPNTPPSFFTT